MADGGPEAIDAQLDDPGIELVPMDDKGVPFFGPLQAFEGLADAEPVQRFAGEVDWVEAGGDIPEKYLEWIEGAEARGARVTAMPLTGQMPTGVDDGVAAVRRRPWGGEARKGWGAKV